MVNKNVHCTPELTGCFLAAPLSLLKKFIIEDHAIAVEKDNDKSIPILYLVSRKITASGCNVVYQKSFHSAELIL